MNTFDEEIERAQSAINYFSLLERETKVLQLVAAYAYMNGLLMARELIRRKLGEI